MSQRRVLVAGVGNIFLGDDGFGCEVARRLAGRGLPEAARVVDFGIRGFDLAYALLDDYELAILVDAAPRGGLPGTLYVIEPDSEELDETTDRDVLVETHGMNPLRVLGLVKALGGAPRRIVVVGCEPAAVGPEEGAVGLSVPVRAAVGEAVTIVESLIAQTLSPGAGEPRVGSTA